MPVLSSSILISFIPPQGVTILSLYSCCISFPIYDIMPLYLLLQNLGLIRVRESFGLCIYRVNFSVLRRKPHITQDVLGNPIDHSKRAFRWKHLAESNFLRT